MKRKKEIKEVIAQDLKKIDDEREHFENRVADILQSISANSTFTKLENEGADELVALGIQAGIALAESATKQNIPVDTTTIDNIADKCSDKLVDFLKKITKLVCVQLRK